MVVPIHEEADWADCFESATAWLPPLHSTLIIAPHPDDESLACGGLIHHLCSQGVDVQVVAVTDGENAYCDGAPLRAVRQIEQRKALRRLGVAAGKIVRLHLPDSGLHTVEEELEEQLAPLISGSTHVVAPWCNDFHPDHEACGRVAKKLVGVSGVALTSYLFWTFHRGSPDLLAKEQLVKFQLNDAQRRDKQAAILCHESQLSHPSGEPILPANLLWPSRLPFEVLIPA